MMGTGRRRVYLMRHGHVDYFNAKAEEFDDVLLTPDGMEQADAAGLALQHIPFDIAVCSGLPRTIQTGERVLARQSAAPKLTIERRLSEVKGGILKATSREEVAAHLAYSFDDAATPGATFLPGGEAYEDAQARVTDGLSDLLTSGDWSVALIVAHEGVNRILLGWVTGGGLKTVGAFEQDLGCINVLDFDITPATSGDGLQIERGIVKALNVTAYDYVKHGLSRTSLEHLFDIDFGGSRPSRSEF